MIPVRIDQLLLSNIGFVVMLKSSQDERILPIFIGAAEAQSIAIKIKEIELPRPLTHDLLKNLLDFLECRLRRIEINDLKDNTFYARLILERDGREMEMDSRPSDALALAMRASAPVVVAEHVMEQAGRVLTESEKQQISGEDQPPEKRGHDMTPLEKLQAKLNKAIEQERYEDAARLRDDIKRLSGPHSDN